MSQSGRPPPSQSPIIGSELSSMAQKQRTSTFPPPSSYGRPVQHLPGPQLPPINSIPSARSTYDEGRSVQLPPMRIAASAASSPVNASSPRSIPVAHLLSAYPPSPPRSQHAAPTQQTMYRQSPVDTYPTSQTEYRMQPMSYQPAPSHRLDHAPVPFRQPQPYPNFQPAPSQQYQRPQPSSVHPSVSNDQFGACQYSPTISGYSSPTSYSHSESSPRSSLARPQQACVSKPPPLDFALTIRQQPVAARACGFGERDRRVIDPPPILELKITDRVTGFPEQDLNAMLALHCTLLSPDGSADETELPSAHPDVPTTRRLMGTLVASPYQAKDENGIAGTFFVFPDLSCRSPGKYRLKFRLLRVDTSNMQLGATHGNVASAMTDVFNVYTAKDFPGMRASSSLLKALRRQGLNVGVKKGSESRKGKTKAKKEVESSVSSSDGEDDSDVEGGSGENRGLHGSGGVSPRTKERQKGKRRKRDC